MVIAWNTEVNVESADKTQHMKPLRNDNFQSANTEYCCNRVFHILLFNQVKEYTLDNFVSSIFPAEVSIEEVREALEADSRICVEENEEMVKVRISKEAADDSKDLLECVEKWKNDMAKYFRENNCDVKLCMLPQLIKRPVSVPREVKLVDILNSDPKRRFLLINSSANSSKKANEETYVKYKHTPEEVEHFHDEWRFNVEEFLWKEHKPVPLVTVGTQVTKPKNLGKNQKLIDVVKADPKRFKLIPDPSHNSLTRICLTEDYCKEQWRQQIKRVFSSHIPSCEQEILHRVPRPLPLRKSIMPSDLFPNQLWKSPRITMNLRKRQFMEMNVSKGYQYHPQKQPPQYSAGRQFALRASPPPGFNKPEKMQISSRSYGHFNGNGENVKPECNFATPVFQRQISDGTNTVLSVFDHLEL